VIQKVGVPQKIEVMPREDPLDSLPEMGSFAHDKPLKVISAKLNDNQITVTIDWQVRANGKKPKPSQFTNKLVRD